MPFSPLRLLLFFLALGVLAMLVQIGLVSIAFDRLGLSADSAYLLLLCTLVGSLINLPLVTLTAEGPPPDMARPMPQLPFFRVPHLEGKTIITVNVGGAVVPTAFSFYLIAHSPLNLLQVAITVTAGSLIAHLISQPIPGAGIGIPALLTPVAAALIATLIDPAQRAPLAYIGGTLGVLIGADLLRLNDIRKLGVSFASIGGAGTFDGVYITGLLAVLLA